MTGLVSIQPSVPEPSAPSASVELSEDLREFAVARTLSVIEPWAR